MELPHLDLLRANAKEISEPFSNLIKVVDAFKIMK